MTLDEMKQAFEILIIAYPKFDTFKNKQLLDKTIGLWHQMFSDVPVDLFVAALKKLILELQFPPTVADVNKRIHEIIKPTSESDAELAWGEVRKAISKYGSYNLPEFSNPIISKIVSSFGWTNICSMPSDEVTIVRKQFLNSYLALEKREKWEKEQLVIKQRQPKIAEAIKLLSKSWEV